MTDPIIFDEDGKIVHLPWSWIFRWHPIPGRFLPLLQEQGFLNGIETTDKWDQLAREEMNFLLEWHRQGRDEDNRAGAGRARR